MLAGGTLQILIWRCVHVAKGRGTLYGLLVYCQGDGAGISFGYGFYRNEAVLLAQAHKPTRSYIHEPVVPVVVHVDVVHVTDEAALGVEDAPLAQFALGGRGCWGNASRMSFIWGLLSKVSQWPLSCS